MRIARRHAADLEKQRVKRLPVGIIMKIRFRIRILPDTKENEQETEKGACDKGHDPVKDHFRLLIPILFLHFFQKYHLQFLC